MIPANQCSCRPTVGLVALIAFVYTCSAVTVNIDNIGVVVEGSETRITCRFVRSSPSSVSTPIVTWNNLTNGVTYVIAQYQGGAGSVQPSYMDRFSVEGDTTLVIANTLRSDSGTYQCHVIIIDDPPSPASDDVILVVSYIGCQNNPCLNGGTCVSNQTSYTCICLPGFTGVNCEAEINECQSNPCQSRGTCRDGINAYTCACTVGYVGTNCETEINECQSNPCQSRGTCIDGINYYTCFCTVGYVGTNCETVDLWSAWSQWYNCSQSCRQFRYRTCNQFSDFEGADCDGDSTEISQMQDCPYTVETLEEFHKGTQFAKSAFQPVCYSQYELELQVDNFDITYCFESYGTVQWDSDVARSIHETIPVTFSIPDVGLLENLCSVSLVWDFAYEEWIEQIKVETTVDKVEIGLNGSSVSTRSGSIFNRSGNYFQASKFLTISHDSGLYFPLVKLYFPPSSIKPEVTLLDDSCSQAAISETPTCAYIDETHSISTIGCVTVANNFTYEGVECQCPLADAYVVILEALPALKLPKAETIVAVTGSGVNMASVLVFFAQRILNGMNIETEGADIFNNILSSILLANGALLFDESVDYFRESSKQEILAQSLAYSLITLNVWMLFWIVDKSIKKQEENKSNRLGSFYQISGWTVPIIYVFLSSCFVENYSSYDYRHWPNIENGAVWTLFGPMAGLFLISLFVCFYKLHKIGKMAAGDNAERWRIRRVMTSLVSYLVALVFLFGKWSMGIWTTNIPILQFIFSLLLWTQFIAVACIYCVYNCCCKSSTRERGSHKNDDKGRDNDNFDMKTEAAATFSHIMQNA